MNKPVCPSCGSPNVEQIDTDKYQCPYCGKTFSENTAPPIPPTQECKESKTENAEEIPNNIYRKIAIIFYLIGLVDFCGMFFNYDFTGVFWSPIAFCSIASIFEWLAKKKGKSQ